MTVKYVVSILGELLYFDSERQPTPPLPEGESSSSETKPNLKLIPASEHPATGAEWDSALAAYSAEQRRAAEISQVT